MFLMSYKYRYTRSAIFNIQYGSSSLVLPIPVDNQSKLYNINMVPVPGVLGVPVPCAMCYCGIRGCLAMESFNDTSRV